jgi:hypothetical protein
MAYQPNKIQGHPVEIKDLERLDLANKIGVLSMLSLWVIELRV